MNSYSVTGLISSVLHGFAAAFDTEVETIEIEAFERGEDRAKADARARKLKRDVKALATVSEQSDNRPITLAALQAYCGDSKKRRRRLASAVEGFNTLVVPGVVVPMEPDAIAWLDAGRGDSLGGFDMPPPTPPFAQTRPVSIRSAIAELATMFATSSKLSWTFIMNQPGAVDVLRAESPVDLRDAFMDVFEAHGVRWASAEASVRGFLGSHGVAMAETQFAYQTTWPPVSPMAKAPPKSPMFSTSTPFSDVQVPSEVDTTDAVKVARLWLSSSMSTRMDSMLSALTRPAIAAFNAYGVFAIFTLAMSEDTHPRTIPHADWPEKTPEGNAITLRDMAQSMVAMLALQGVTLPLDYTHPTTRPTHPKPSWAGPAGPDRVELPPVRDPSTAADMFPALPSGPGSFNDRNYEGEV
jgi:hypothetical protein